MLLLPAARLFASYEVYFAVHCPASLNGTAPSEIREGVRKPNHGRRNSSRVQHMKNRVFSHVPSKTVGEGPSRKSSVCPHSSSQLQAAAARGSGSFPLLPPSLLIGGTFVLVVRACSAPGFPPCSAGEVALGEVLCGWWYSWWWVPEPPTTTTVQVPGPGDSFVSPDGIMQGINVRLPAWQWAGGEKDWGAGHSRCLPAVKSLHSGRAGRRALARPLGKESLTSPTYDWPSLLYSVPACPCKIPVANPPKGPRGRSLSRWYTRAHAELSYNETGAGLSTDSLYLLLGRAHPGPRGMSS